MQEEFEEETRQIKQIMAKIAIKATEKIIQEIKEKTKELAEENGVKTTKEKEKKEGAKRTRILRGYEITPEGNKVKRNATKEMKEMQDKITRYAKDRKEFHISELRTELGLKWTSAIGNALYALTRNKVLIKTGYGKYIHTNNKEK